MLNIFMRFVKYNKIEGPLCSNLYINNLSQTLCCNFELEMNICFVKTIIKTIILVASFGLDFEEIHSSVRIQLFYFQTGYKTQFKAKIQENPKGMNHIKENSLTTWVFGANKCSWENIMLGLKICQKLTVTKKSLL